ncbi:hypothetical protein FRC06_006311 [Ceratobasidium sp. 370]|nr:hypothetical protein FRC06_006311 [Ceratobasidium sp. 370]
MLDPDAAASAADDHTVTNTVLKLLWRDPAWFQESLILNQFIGVCGICQVVSNADATIDGKHDVVYPRASLFPGSCGHVFGESSQNLDISGVQRDDARILSLLLMQPGRPLSEAKDTSELKAAFMAAIMSQWALVNSHVQHRDMSINNILLSSPRYDYELSEYEQLWTLGAEACGRAFKAPEWETICNEPVAPSSGSSMAALGPRPFGFLSDVDLANILSIARAGASDMHMHRTGTLSFMALTLMAKDSEAVEHSDLHDLESFFWVLLYVVAGIAKVMI